MLYVIDDLITIIWKMLGNHNLVLMTSYDDVVNIVV